MRKLLFVLTAVVLAAGAGSAACSGDDGASSSPLQPSPLATAPDGPARGGPD